MNAVIEFDWHTICTCGVMTGGALDRRAGCPMHPLSWTSSSWHTMESTPELAHDEPIRRRRTTGEVLRHYLPIRVTETLKDAMYVRALADGVSISSVARRAIEAYLDSADGQETAT